MQLYDPEGRRLYFTEAERRAFLQAAARALREVRSFCDTFGAALDVGATDDLGAKSRDRTALVAAALYTAFGGDLLHRRRGHIRRQPR